MQKEAIGMKKMKTFLRVCFFLWFGGFVYLLSSQETDLERNQVLKFSHKFHLQELEMACVDCHSQVVESVRSDNAPPTFKEKCAECHDIETEGECQVCHFENEDTRQALKPRVFEISFNHKMHIETEGLDCVECHSNLDKVDYSDAASMPAMTTCARCHNNQVATLECAVCHIHTESLRPVNHGADFLVSHKNLARLQDENCQQCHTQNDCSECHDPGGLLTFTSGDVNTGVSPSMSPFGTKQLTVLRLHEPNFRVTHPLSATGRTQECAVCHDTQTFCQTCHEAEGVDVAGKPLWHGGPDWGAFAGLINTGGGRHAELARRDIENCVACHDVEGADPTCMLCHTDFDGIPGTNPKTHGESFANDIGKGDFHSDDNALCFACHTNTRQRGSGFCGNGYCHQ